MFKMYLLLGGIHYTLDTGVKIYTYGFTIFSDPCKLWYTMHHLLTIFNFKSLWMIDHYTWFLAIVPAYHCMMSGCPDFFLNNHIYGVCLTSYIVSLIFIPTFNKTRIIRMILFKTLCLAIVIMQMGKAGECTTQWNTDAMQVEFAELRKEWAEKIIV